ncbi:hypothetical protein Q0812_13400 [Brevundimonas sp. 2R-24]|uniref:Uncharacterized protein n=1 Tax=Peiella sedimenti TaxID=3061083 RepID=A0ABT8SPA9_9CAUL|nr:hypothetical protein [Caulobacteraceae bacterium XZ-24]
MGVRYAWKPGSRINLDAEKAGRELEDIRKQSGGALTQEAVVERARSANSVLHSHFTWEDAEAAEKWRLSQAGDLIRAIVIDVSRSNVEESKLLRAFVNVEQKGQRHYTSTVVALSDIDLRAQVLRRAWEELEAWRQRHAELVEFARVFSAIDETKRA